MKFKITFLNKWVILGTGLIVFFTAILLLEVIFHNSCLISLITGFPCFSCGMTRANILALQFKFSEAFQMHPLWFLTYIILGELIIVTAKPKFGHSKIVIAANLLMILALLVTYIVRMCMLFPNKEPLTFNEDSLLGLIISLFK